MTLSFKRHHLGHPAGDILHKTPLIGHYHEEHLSGQIRGMKFLF
jgi:hypothetical protein